MCIVNTAAVAMMLPILTAVTAELYPEKAKAAEAARETGSSVASSSSDLEMNRIILEAENEE